MYYVIYHTIYYYTIYYFRLYLKQFKVQIIGILEEIGFFIDQTLQELGKLPYTSYMENQVWMSVLSFLPVLSVLAICTLEQGNPLKLEFWKRTIETMGEEDKRINVCNWQWQTQYGWQCHGHDQSTTKTPFIDHVHVLDHNHGHNSLPDQGRWCEGVERH